MYYRWPISGYPQYSVDSEGMVLNHKRGKFLSGRLTKDGYLHVRLYDGNGNSQEKKVHRLVAEEFIENPLDLPEVNHLDQDKTNNRVDNLEWCTQEYNLEYSNSRHFIFLKDGELVHIYNLSRYCRENNVSYHGLYDLFRGRSQQHAGYTMPVGG